MRKRLSVASKSRTFGVSLVNWGSKRLQSKYSCHSVRVFSPPLSRYFSSEATALSNSRRVLLTSWESISRKLPVALLIISGNLSRDGKDSTAIQFFNARRTATMCRLSSPGVLDAYWSNTSRTTVISASSPRPNCCWSFSLRRNCFHRSPLSVSPNQLFIWSNACCTDSAGRCDQPRSMVTKQLATNARNTNQRLEKTTELMMATPLPRWEST